MRSVEALEFTRNYGFWSRDEQEALLNTNVALAGAGGDGFQLGISLAMMGINNFSIADPEVFEPENANRVIGANHFTYGQKKVEILRNNIYAINPDAKVRIYDEGVTEDNVNDFMHDTKIVFDESELTYLHIGTMIAREARKNRVPNVLVMNLGFAAVSTSFHPESKYTFEKIMGVNPGMPLDEIKEQKVHFDRCLPYVPRYGDLKTLEAVQQGASLPSIIQGVNVAAALGSSQAFLHITNVLGNHRKKPIYAPRFAYMDSYSLESGVVRYPKLSHYKLLSKAIVRNYLNFNPRASYK